MNCNKKFLIGFVLGLLSGLLILTTSAQAIPFNYETPTPEILYEIEQQALNATDVEGLISNEAVLMYADLNYNFKIDSVQEVAVVVDLYFKTHWITVDQVALVVDYYFNGSSFAKVITVDEILAEITEAPVLLLDNKYYLANIYSTKRFVQLYVNKSWYSIPWYDCDDYAWLAMGILHKQKEPAASATFYALVTFEYNKQTYGHTLLLLKALNGAWYYYDPITGYIIPKSYSPFKLVFMMG
jgi:hypothetical protein